jgi:hypothetical protein
MLLVMALTHPDIEGFVDGMRHVVWQIVECARSIRKQEFPDEADECA